MLNKDLCMISWERCSSTPGNIYRNCVGSKVRVQKKKMLRVVVVVAKYTVLTIEKGRKYLMHVWLSVIKLRCLKYLNNL